MIKIITDGSEKQFFQTCYECQTDYIYQKDDVYNSGTVTIPPHTICPKCKSLNKANFIQTYIDLEGKRPAQEGDQDDSDDHTEAGRS